MTLKQLVMQTEAFLKHAEAMYKSGILTDEEYYELTYKKKIFLEKAKQNLIVYLNDADKDNT